jgi:hypothetical protein
MLSGTVYCSCGREFAAGENIKIHQMLIGENNKHNHKKVPVKAEHFPDASSIMFSIWAWDRSCTSQAADILVHATHHIHISRVIDMEISPIKELIDLDSYHEALVYRAICDAFESAIDNGENPMLNRVEHWVRDLLRYCSRVEDENEEILTKIVNQWRVLHA